jgi:release factor glutamine methyltransferase
LQNPLFSETEKFDIITINPPYIRSGDMDSLSREVRDLNRGLPWTAGEDGLAFYRAALKGAPGASEAGREVFFRNRI